MESAFSRLNQRSVLTFLLLTVIAGAVSLFLLRKANDAINEIDGIQTEPLFLARKELLSDGEVSADVDKWKTYKNNAYGFEVRYPGDFEESTSLAEFGASGDSPVREVFVNAIPPVASFNEYLNALIRIRNKGQREGRIAIFKKGPIAASGRSAFQEELYDVSINSFVVRTFIDFMPLGIISITVRESGGRGKSDSAPRGLIDLSTKIISTVKRTR